MRRRRTISQSLPGTYSVAELVPAGWTLASIAIVDPTGNSTSVGSTATLNLAAGETITVTFTDTKLGHIIVDKVTNPAGDPTSFTLQHHRRRLLGLRPDRSAAPNDQTLLPGTYTVAELVPAGWTLSSIVIVDPSGDSTSAAARPRSRWPPAKRFGSPTPTRRCAGSIGGTKYLDVTGNGLTPRRHADGRRQDLSRHEQQRRRGIRGEPSMMTAANGTYSFTNLAAGTYNVREVVPSGYVRTAPTLTDKYTINLAAGGSLDRQQLCQCREVRRVDLCNVVYVVNGTTFVTDLRGNTNEGDTVQVSFTVPAGPRAAPLHPGELHGARRHVRGGPGLPAADL